MATGVEITFSGPNATMASYFEAIERLGGTREGKHPDPGCLFHCVTETSGGYRVVDVWEDQGQFDKFIRDKVGPVMDDMGIDQPQVKYIDIANYMTSG
jgi:hypothetical protein